MFSSLLPSSLFSTVSQFCCVILGGYAGSWVDRSNRLRIQQTALLVQNVSEVLAFVLLILLAHRFIGSHRINPMWKDPLFDALFFGAIALGAAAAVAGMVGSISMSKDWLVTIQRAHPYLPLSNVNSTYRRIDLICKFFAPLVFAAIVKYAGLTVSLIIVSSWNAISVIPEMVLQRVLYNRVPELGFEKEKSSHKSKPNPFLQIVAGWRAYWSQPILRSSIAYVLLFMTVLSPGSVMTAYLDFKNLNEFFIALLNGIGALVGLLATIASPYLIKHLKIRTTGFLALIYQWSILTLTLIPFVFQAPIILLPIFVALSRFGLWSFDLVEVQLMQTYVPEQARGAVSGVEMSLTNLLAVGSFAMGIIVPDPKNFIILVGVSLCFVTSALTVYSWWYLRPPKSIRAIEESIENGRPVTSQESSSLLSHPKDDIYQSESDSTNVPLMDALDIERIN